MTLLFSTAKVLPASAFWCTDLLLYVLVRILAVEGEECNCQFTMANKKGGHKGHLQSTEADINSDRIRFSDAVSFGTLSK